MKVQTQTEEIRRLRRTNLELIFSDHNAYCLPPCQNKCPSHIDIPGFLKANAEANWRESTRIFKRTIPFPSVLGRVCPAPCEEHCRRDEVDEAIAIRDSHRYAGDQVLKSMLDDGRRPAAAVRAPGGVRSARRGHRLRPGRHGRRVLPAAGRPRRDRLRARPGARRDAPLRDPAVPPAEGRGPRGRVRVGHPARRQDGLQRGPRPRLHARRPVQPGLRRGRRRDRLLRHEQAGHPRRGRGRGPRRPRVPAHRDAGPAVSGPRRQARRRHRRRVHLDGLLADVGPPGRQRGDARLPPRHEGHARLERGPRGHRGRRHRHLPGRPRAGRPRRRGQRHRRRVHPHGPRRARRLRAPPPGAGPRHRVRRPVRPRAARHRPGPGPHLDRARVGGPGGHQAAPAQGRRGHVRDRPARRVRHRRRAHRRRDRGPGHRRGPPLRLRGGRVPQGPRPDVDPEPPDARRAAARVPLDRPVHRRDQGAALPDDGHGGRGAQPQLHRVRAARTPARPRSPSRPAACSARARRSGSATCAAWASSTAPRSRRSSRSTTRARATGA